MAIFHGDTRGGEPVGVPFLDALADEGTWDAQKGVFLLAAPGGELAFEYHALLADEAARDRFRAARATLPPARLGPATDMMWVQATLPPERLGRIRAPAFVEMVAASRRRAGLPRRRCPCCCR
ncbi:MAG: hypothetical protein R3F43_07715 [bacterium]